jgi:hypothetical protein
VGLDRVVVASPAFDDDLGLAQSVEDLSIEQLIAKACIEALDVAVLPRAAALDICGYWRQQPRSIFARPRRRTPVHCRTGCDRDYPGIGVLLVITFRRCG